jgi:hypothetical protein
MAFFSSGIDATDNGGRRRVRDRRFLVSAVPLYRERRTNWERRSGFDRRLRHLSAYPEDRRMAEEPDKASA